MGACSSGYGVAAGEVICKAWEACSGTRGGLAWISLYLAARSLHSGLRFPGDPSPADALCQGPVRQAIESLLEKSSAKLGKPVAERGVDSIFTWQSQDRVARQRPRPTLRQGCMHTCWAPTGDHGTYN